MRHPLFFSSNTEACVEADVSRPCTRGSISLEASRQTRYTGLMSHFAIDRFEDNGWAVLERSDSETFNVPREWLPEDAKEGDVLNADVASEGKASRLSFTLDAVEKERRLEEVRELRESRPVAPEGDIEL